MKYLLFIFVLLFISNSLAQHVKEFSYLKKYAGEYSSNEILNDKKLKPIILKMMGVEYDHLVSNLSVGGPVDLISGDIVISGNAPHQGGEEMAILDINLYTGIIRAAIYSNNKIIVYSDKQKYDEFIDKNKYDQLPVSILEWISLVNNQSRQSAGRPKNVTIK